MPLLPLLSAVHAVLLLFFSYRAAAGIFVSPFPRVFATAILAWANLAHTAMLASPFHLLGSPGAYLAISVAISLIYLVFFRWLGRDGAVADGLRLKEIWAQIRSSPFALLALGLLVFWTGCVLLIGARILPNNWDTLAYRMPRAFFYLTWGGLTHPGSGIDTRLLYYPYNGSALYVFMAQYQWPGMAWNSLSIFTWMLAGAGAFYVPLLLGASARAAVLSMYLLLTAPVVLCLANSTNDELLAGAPLLLGVIFLILWLRHRSFASFAVGLLAISLSVGVKLHWIFLMPCLLGLLVYLFVRRRAELAGTVRTIAKPAPLAGALLLATPLATGFMVSNYVSAGQITHSKFNAQVTIQPYSPAVAAQTLRLFTTQLLLAPIPDHFRFLGAEQGARIYRIVNHMTRPLFLGVQQGHPFTATSYRFRGLVVPYAEVFFEETLWMGLMPHLVLLVLFWLLRERTPLPLLVWCLLLAGPLWHIGICAMHRYVECVGTYYAYIAPLCLAPLGWVWERAKNSPGWMPRLISSAFVLAFASNTLLAGTLLFGSLKRSVPEALRNPTGETTVSATTPEMRQALAQARSVYIPYTHWELLYWNFMRLNPAARYETRLHPTPYPDSARTGPPDLTILSYASRFSWYYPLPVHAEGLGELRYMGSMSDGENLIFCRGSACEAACARCDRYLYLPMSMERHGGQLLLAGTGAAEGFLPQASTGSEQAAVRFAFYAATHSRSYTTSWIPIASIERFRVSFPDQGFEFLTVESRCAVPGCSGGRTVFPLQPGSRVLVDRQPAYDPELESKVEEVVGDGWKGTEVKGYWNFIWRRRPGSNVLDAEWKGGGGEVVKDELIVASITDTEILFLRKSMGGYYVGRRRSPHEAYAKGNTTWDPSNIWEGRKMEGIR